MLQVKNIKVYDLKESVIASRNAMRLTPPEYTDDEFNASLARAIALAHTPTGSGHQTWLSGVRVSFDIIYPNYISPELQRYHWIDIVTSSSKMHRLTKMNMDTCFNEWVTEQSREQMRGLVREYNAAVETGDKDCIYHAFMRVVSNCPQGIELFMRVSTNYLQLKTIVRQRKNHKLRDDWDSFINAMRTLPYANDFIFTD